MLDAPLGITFREQMAGAFSLGATDPRAGAAQGAGTPLTMHATVAVRDVDAFIADPNHMGELTGEIDFAPFGVAIPAKRGVFNLFSPSGDPKLKYMVYELEFTVGADAYYLAGKKEVRDDPGFDMLSDTTTLYTVLHKGRDATGPIVGAGVLRLDMGDFARLLTTIRPLGSTSHSDAGHAVMKFSRFFAGQLLESYGGALGRALGSHL